MAICFWENLSERKVQEQAVAFTGFGQKWLWSEVAHSGWVVRSRGMCQVWGKGECEPEVLSVLDSYPQCNPWAGHAASLPLAWYLDERQPLRLQLSLCSIVRRKGSCAGALGSEQQCMSELKSSSVGTGSMGTLLVSLCINTEWCIWEKAFHGKQWAKRSPLSWRNICGL